MSLRDEQSNLAETHINEDGGKQSHIKRDYTLIPMDALAKVAEVMYQGSLKYEKDNWRLINIDSHLNHAVNHIVLYLAENSSEEHLAHAATRLLMAVELQNNSKKEVDTNQKVA